jgi:hypothetical protein
LVRGQLDDHIWLTAQRVTAYRHPTDYEDQQAQNRRGGDA